MKSLLRGLFYFTIACSTCIVIVSLLSLVYDIKFWYFKILDFPRQQYLILGAFFLFLLLFLTKKWNFPAIFLGLGLLISIWIQGRVILPYYFGDKTVADATVQTINQENRVKILIANVLITNRNSKQFLDIVRTEMPDMVLVMEVDEWWQKELKVLNSDFPHRMEYPLDNAYGMSLYSKFPLKNQEILFLNKDDVPSFETEVLLNSGESFVFLGVHPVAPVPSNKYPDNVGEKEVALVKVGDIAAGKNLPVIVAGDFNDVSWSHTSRLFEKTGDLKNVRIGRGIYNSFDATSPILRWPLDHFFVTPEFSIIKLERLKKFGSDHFPMVAEFVLSD